MRESFRTSRIVESSRVCHDPSAIFSWMEYAMPFPGMLTCSAMPESHRSPADSTGLSSAFTGSVKGLLPLDVQHKNAESDGQGDCRKYEIVCQYLGTFHRLGSSPTLHLPKATIAPLFSVA